MPIYCTRCTDESCPASETVEERYYGHVTLDDPPCSICGAPRRRIPAQFRVIWTGPITTRYNDKRAEGADQEGHWAWRVRSAKGKAPEPVRIETFDDQRRFCKEEGLVNPKDIPTNAQISSDGKKLSSRGMPGQWV